MIEPISTAAAMAIAKIAFDKFIEGGAIELGKNATIAASEKVQKLAMVVWSRIKGNTKAIQVLEAAEDKPEEMQKLKNYLHSLWKDENSEFAQEVKKLADEIHFELTQIEDNSSMTQINRDQSTGYQTRTGPDNTNFFGGTHNHGK